MERNRPSRDFYGFPRLFWFPVCPRFVSIFASIFALTLIFSAASPGFATDWYVNDASTTNDVYTTSPGADFNGGSLSAPFLTIGRAMSAASSGDRVFVDAGVYSGQVVIDKDYISLIGADSSSTVLDFGDSSLVTTEVGIAARGLKSRFLKGVVVEGFGIRHYDLGIEYRYVERSRIRNVTAQRCRRGGVLIIRTDTCEFQNFYLTRNGLTTEPLADYVGGGYGINVAMSRWNTLKNIVSINNARHGLYMTFSSYNEITNGVFSRSGLTGYHHLSYSHYNVVRGNRMEENGWNGMVVQQGSTGNQIAQNIIANNKQHGIHISTSPGSIIHQNDIFGNAGKQISMTMNDGISLFQKNNIGASTINPTDARVYVSYSKALSSLTHDLRRHWWGTTDESKIHAMFQAQGVLGSGVLDTFVYIPYRLGPADTAAGADTRAPAPPGNMGLTSGSGQVLVTWTNPAVDEEGSQPLSGFGGVRIYRMTNTGDIRNWAAYRVATVSSPATSYADTGANTNGVTYYYRLTSIDTHPIVNESFFGDSRAITYVQPVVSQSTTTESTSSTVSTVTAESGVTTATTTSSTSETVSVGGTTTQPIVVTTTTSTSDTAPSTQTQTETAVVVVQQASGAVRVTVARGANNPVGRSVDVGEQGVPMLQFTMVSNDTITITDLSCTSIGSGHEPSAVYRVHLYLDANGDGGNTGIGDTLLGWGFFTSDDGSITFSGLSVTLKKDVVSTFLVTYSLTANGLNGEAFQARLASGNFFAATGATGGLNVAGLPVEGETVTLRRLQNQAPCTPVLSSPVAGSTGVSTYHTFSVGGYCDAEGTLHKYTQWQITDSTGLFDNAHMALNMRAPAETAGLRFHMPRGLLKGGEIHYWRTRFSDGDDLWSPWSDTAAFRTALDTFQVAPTTTMRKENLKAPDTRPIEFKLNSGGAERVTLMGGVDFKEAVDDTGRKQKTSEEFKFGLYTFSIENLTVGGTVAITFDLPEDLPTNAKYFIFDASKGWLDMTSRLSSHDGDSYVVLTLTDGAEGDLDGVANGAVVDPGGFQTEGSAVSGSGGGSSLVDYAKYPNACIIGRGLPKNDLSFFRRIRDDLLISSWGRKAVEHYYRF